MRRRFRKRDDQAGVNMTAMLDIAFILLIFFIVSMTFPTEEGIDWRQPDATGAICDCPIPILVQIDGDNQVFVDRDRIDIDRLMAVLDRILAEEPNNAVLLEVHDESSHGVVVRIWDELTANRIPTSLQRAWEADT